MTVSGYVDAVRTAAALWPDMTAVEDGTATSSYADLLARASSLAAEIAQVAPEGSVLGVRLPQGIDYISSVLAVRMAGCGVLLLDPLQPVERDASLCGDAAAMFVIGEPPGTGGPQRFDPGMTIMNGVRRAPLGDAVEFVLGTSGSSGKPKAVVHTDGSMLAWGRAVAAACGHEPGDRIVSMSSPATLGGISGITAGLVSGAAQRCLNLGGRGLPALLDAFRDGRVRSFRGTPSLVRMLASVTGFVDMTTGLATMSLYGEPVTWDDLRAIERLLPTSCRIRITYGSTEAGGCSWFPTSTPTHGGKVPAGRPFPDVSVSIVSADCVPVPDGTEGEIVVAGGQNSIGTIQGGRLVRHRHGPLGLPSGDIGRIDGDGNIEVLGRMDRAIKINGVRIDLSEVEAVVRRCSGVSRAEVVAVPRGNGCRIVAFMTSDSRDASVRDVEREAASKLPGSTAPRVVRLDAIPTLAIGKVDVAELVRRAKDVP